MIEEVTQNQMAVPSIDKHDGFCHPPEPAITWHESGVIRRHTCRIDRFHWNLIYTRLPNGSYWIIDFNNYVCPSIPQLIRTTDEFNSWMEHFDKSQVKVVPIDWEDHSEQVIKKKLTDVYGKYWIHPFTGSIFQILKWENIEKRVHVKDTSLIIINVKMIGGNLMQMYSNSHMFDFFMLTPEEFIFDKLEDVHVCLARMYRKHAGFGDRPF